MKLAVIIITPSLLQQEELVSGLVKWVGLAGWFSGLVFVTFQSHNMARMFVIEFCVRWKHASDVSATKDTTFYQRET